MDRTKNYYQILNVEKISTFEDIKKSYRKLSFTHHPDKGGNQEDFNEINEAYTILSDVETRNKYDKTSIYGLLFDESILYNDFDYNDDSKTWDEDKFQKFKKDEQLNIIEYIDDTFNGTIIYNRFVLCKKCKGSGKDTESKIVIKDKNGKVVKVFEGDEGCDFCEGTGKGWDDKDCSFCFGNGKIGNNDCNTCNGEKRILGKQKITNVEMSIDEKDKCIEFMGHISKNIPGKSGHLWLVRK